MVLGLDDGAGGEIIINELELRHGWLERQGGYIICLLVFIALADFDFRWGGGGGGGEGGLFLCACVSGGAGLVGRRGRGWWLYISYGMFLSYHWSYPASRDRVYMRV